MKYFEYKKLSIGWFWPVIFNGWLPDVHFTECCYFYFSWGPLEIRVTR